MRILCKALIASVAVGCLFQGPALAREGVTREPLVYGKDGRTEARQHPDPALRALAGERSVALVKKDALTITRDQVTFSAPALSEALDVCPSEPFADQPLLAECSGTLIAPDLVLTAGHCVDEAGACDALYFVLGYELGAEGSVVLDRDRIFGCARILALEVTSFNEPVQYDYALVQLDRAADPAPAPLTVRRTPVEPKEPLVLIGNGLGLGLPTKVDDRGLAVYGRPDSADYFEGRFDNFHRGSGSGVFDAQRRLVGIAVRGGVDFEGNPECLAMRRVPDDYPHLEEATYAANALERAGFPELVAATAEPAPATALGADSSCSVATPQTRTHRESLIAIALFALANLCRLGRRRTVNRKNKKEEP